MPQHFGYTLTTRFTIDNYVNEHISNNEGMQKSLEQDRYFKN